MRLDEREAHKGSVARNIIFLGGIHFLKHYALAVDDLNIARPLILNQLNRAQLLIIKVHEVALHNLTKNVDESMPD